MRLRAEISGTVGVGDGLNVTEDVDVGERVVVVAGVGEVVGVGVGEAVGVGVGLVTFTCVIDLPPDPSIKSPSGPTMTSLGSGCELLGKSVPLTW